MVADRMNEVDHILEIAGTSCQDVSMEVPVVVRSLHANIARHVAYGHTHCVGISLSKLGKVSKTLAKY